MRAVLDTIGLTDISSFVWGAVAMLILICVILPVIVNAPLIEEREEEHNG